MEYLFQLLTTMLPILAILGIAILLLSVGIIIKGKFPNSHISKSRYGISCAKTQYTAECVLTEFAVSEHSSPKAAKKPTASTAGKEKEEA